MAQLSNIKLPNISEESLNNKKEMKQIKDYLFQLTEQLRFVLNNIDDENFSEEVKVALENAKKMPDILTKEMEKVSADGVKMNSRITQTAEAIQTEVTRATQSEGNLSSKITQTADQIETKVSRDGIISAINQTAELIKILASRIKLEGYTTINNNFAIDESGNAILKGKYNTIMVNDYGLVVKDNSTGNIVSRIYVNSIQTGLVIAEGLSLSGGIGTITVDGKNLYTFFADKSHSHSEYSPIGHGHSTGNTVGASFENSSIGTADLIGFSNTTGNSHAATAGFVKAYAQPQSDERLKENIVALGDITEKYMSLKPISYVFKDGASYHKKINFGFKAQDIDKLYPKEEYALVNIDKEPLKGQKKYCKDYILTLNQNNLHALHVKMIQKQQVEINSLKNELSFIKELLSSKGII